MNTLTFSHAYSNTPFTGFIRSVPEHFFVSENLGFDLSGTGEHAFILIEKSGLTTHRVREAIAKLACCELKDVGYSGLKDKNAVTRQWFSIYLPGKADPSWSALEHEFQLVENDRVSIKLLTVNRHSKKLKIGVHKSNDFVIMLDKIMPLTNTVKNQKFEFDNWLEKRCAKIVDQGVPNYFGEQRFGFAGQNVDKALAMFNRRQRISRNKRSLYLSAARSFLFNQLLSLRITKDTWLSYVDGDVLMLNGSHSQFALDTCFAQSFANERQRIEARLVEGDLHITGMMFGAQYHKPSAEAGDFEQTILNQQMALCSGLENSGVKAARRSLRVIPQRLEYTRNEGQLQLSFQLPAGSYATAVLREIIDYTDASYST